MTQSITDPAVHRKLAVELFNFVWTLLDKEQRTPDENEQMVHAAHASRFHWGLAGTAKEWSVGEWQISRVYSVLKRPESATHHGRLAMHLARDNNLGPFFLAYGHEALARGYAVAGDNENACLHLRAARETAAAIPEDDNRKMLADDLASIILPPLKK